VDRFRDLTVKHVHFTETYLARLAEIACGSSHLDAEPPHLRFASISLEVSSEQG